MYVSRKKYINSDFDQLTMILQGLKTNFITFTPFKNLYILDYTIESRKLVMLLLKRSDLLYAEDGEISVVHPEFELKTKLILKDDWTVCLIDFREFEDLGDKRSEWLKNRIEESYKLTDEKYSSYHKNKRIEVLNNFFNQMAYEFRDKKFREVKKKSELIEKERERVLSEYSKNNK